MASNSLSQEHFTRTSSMHKIRTVNREKCLAKFKAINLLSQKHVSLEDEMRQKLLGRRNARAVTVRRGTVCGHTKITIAFTPVYENTRTAIEGRKKEN